MSRENLDNRKNNNWKLLLVICIVSGSINILLACVIMYYKHIGENHKYFISEAAAYQGIKNNNAKESEIASRVFVSKFVYNMFSYDQDNFNDKTEKALKLIDKPSGTYIYNELMKSGIYDKMKTENSRIDLKIDTILINVKDEYPVKVYARQQLIYSDVVGQIPLAARMKIQHVKRGDENPEGLKITNWEFIKYQKIK